MNFFSSISKFKFERDAILINTVALILSLSFLGVDFLFRYQYGELWSFRSESIRAIMLAILLLLLPDLIGSYFKFKRKGWVQLTVLFGLAALGMVIQMPNWLLISISVIFLIYHIYLIFLGSKFKISTYLRYILYLVIMIPPSILLVTIFYNSGYQNPLFMERIVSGEAQIDTIFHSALSFIFLNTHIPSTALNATPYVHYHYGSHIIFAGLSNLVNVKPIVFYNIFYPIVFVPFFLKSILMLSNSVLKKKLNNLKPIILIYSSLVGLLFLLPQTLLSLYLPYISESYTVAISISFLILYDIMFMLNSINDTRWILFKILAYSILGLLVLVFFKVSVGYIFLGIISYLLFRYYTIKHYSLYVFSIIGLLILLWFYSMFELNRSTGGVPVYNQLIIQIRFVLIPLIAFLLIIGKENIFYNFKNKISLFISNKKYIYFEICVVTIFLSILPGIILKSMNFSDILYFTSYPIILGIGILLPFIIEYFQKLNIFSDPINLSKKISVIIIIFYVSFFTVLSSWFNYKNIPKFTQNDSFNKYSGLLTILNNIEYDPNTALYIPKTNNSYWDWQKDWPRSIYFIIPAISGMPQVQSIPTDSVYIDYSFNYYKSVVLSQSLDDVLLNAKSLGYNKLLVINNELGIDTLYIQK